MEPEDATNTGVDDFARARNAAAGGLGPDDVGQADGDDDAHEVEHDGEVYRIPNALKGAFLNNADYARKAKELAGHQRALQAQRAAHVQDVETAHAHLEDWTQLRLLDHQLATYEAADWRSLAAEAPEQAEALWGQFQQTRAVREQYADQIEHGHELGRLQAARAQAAAMAEAGQTLSREIEGWSPEVAAKLVEYAAAFGVSLDELREVADPRIWKLLHRAHLGEQLSKQQETARRAAQTQAVRPAVRVSGAALGGGGVRDELATGEWIRRRNEQTRRS